MAFPVGANEQAQKRGKISFIPAFIQNVIVFGVAGICVQTIPVIYSTQIPTSTWNRTKNIHIQWAYSTVRKQIRANILRGATPVAAVVAATVITINSKRRTNEWEKVV